VEPLPRTPSTSATRASARPQAQRRPLVLSSAGQYLASAPGAAGTAALSTPPLPGAPAPALGEEDDENSAMQQAICQSLEESDRQRRLLEEKRLAAEAEESERQREAAKRRRPLPPNRDLANTFRPTQWLSDDSIAFVYSMMDAGDMDAVGSGARPGSTDFSGAVCKEGDGLPESILLIDPATAFWMQAADDLEDLEAAKKALRLSERSVVLCPINDSRNGGRADDGTHWSLLVGWRRSLSGPLSFGYYDSLSSGPASDQIVHQAEALACRLAGKGAKVVPSSCSQQCNSFDCGVYVLAFSEIIVASVLEAQGAEFARVGAAAWEERLRLLTAKQVADRRVAYYNRLSMAASSAVGGA